MIKLKIYPFVRIIAFVLVATFIAFDVSWAYPPEENTQTHALALWSGFQQSIFVKEAGSALVIQSIATNLFGNADKGGQRFPLKDLTEIVAADLGRISEKAPEIKRALETIDVSRVAVARWENGKFVETGLGKDKFVPADAILLIPYKKDGKGHIIQVALKESPNAKYLIGEDMLFLLDDRFVVKDVSRDWKEPAILPSENSNSAIESVFVAHPPADDSLSSEPSKTPSELWSIRDSRRSDLEGFIVFRLIIVLTAITAIAALPLFVMWLKNFAVAHSIITVFMILCGGYSIFSIVRDILHEKRIKREEERRRSALIIKAQSGNAIEIFEAITGDFEDIKNIAIANIAKLKNIKTLTELLDLSFTRDVKIRGIILDRLFGTEDAGVSKKAQEIIGKYLRYKGQEIPADIISLLCVYISDKTDIDIIQNMINTYSSDVQVEIGWHYEKVWIGPMSTGPSDAAYYKLESQGYFDEGNPANWEDKWVPEHRTDYDFSKLEALVTNPNEAKKIFEELRVANIRRLFIEQMTNWAESLNPCSYPSDERYNNAKTNFSNNKTRLIEALKTIASLINNRQEMSVAVVVLQSKIQFTTEIIYDGPPEYYGASFDGPYYSQSELEKDRLNIPDFSGLIDLANNLSELRQMIDNELAKQTDNKPVSAETILSAEQLTVLNREEFTRDSGFYGGEGSLSEKFDAVLKYQGERGVPPALRGGINYWEGARGEELVQAGQSAGVSLYKVFNMGRDQNFRDAPPKGARPECLLCVGCRNPEDRGTIIDEEWEAKANLYPIFKGNHGILIYRDHTPQRLEKTTIRKALAWSREAGDYRFFYNGINAGATSEKHLHIQFFKIFEPFTDIGQRSPVEALLQDENNLGEPVRERNKVAMHLIKNYPTKENAIATFLIRGGEADIETIAEETDMLLRVLDKEDLDYDVMWKKNGCCIDTIVFPRSNKQVGSEKNASTTAKTVAASKSCLLGKDKDGNRVKSRVFATIEFIGIFVGVDEEQYNQITYDDLVAILNQLGLPVNNPLCMHIINSMRSGSPERVKQLFDIVKEKLNNNMARIVEAANKLSSPEGEKIDVAQTTIAIKSKITDLAARVAKAADLKNSFEQLDADSMVASLIVRAREAKRQGQKLYVGIATDWMPVYNDENSFQHKAMNSLVNEIKSIPDALRSMGLDNVELIIKENSDELAIDASRRADPPNTVIIASKVAIESGKFDALKTTDKKDGAFLAGIDTAELMKLYGQHEELSDKQLDIDILEILSLVLEISTGKEPPNMPLVISYDKKTRVLILLPSAKVADYQKLMDINKGRIKALQAA